LQAGGKLSVPVIPVLKLGVSGSYTFISRATMNGWDILDPSALPQAAGLAWNALATLRFQDLALPIPNVMVNCGRIGRETQMRRPWNSRATSSVSFWRLSRGNRTGSRAVCWMPRTAVCR
jgi:hypothetical protein